MKALIFGINGQDGVYINELLAQNGILAIGVSRSVGNWIRGDVSDCNFVREIISTNRPDFIFHLAANSSTRHDVVFENHETISTGTLNILEAVYRFSPGTKVFLAGSGLQFVNKGIPISEKDPFDATSPYAVARIQSVYAARYYRSLGLRVYIGYFFNHDSPYRSERHVNQKIVQAVKRIKAGSSEQLELFDVSVRKEFTFAGDVAEAIFTLVKNDAIYEAVIGSGKAYSIEEWLDICFSYFKMDWRDKVKDSAPLKKEYDILVSDPSTIFELGWRPKMGISDLAKLMIET